MVTDCIYSIDLTTNSNDILSITSDDYGTSYYYRENVEHNYVTFNNMCWRIVRIKGDGSIKLVLADHSNACESENYSKINDTSGIIGKGEYPSIKDERFSIIPLLSFDFFATASL